MRTRSHSGRSERRRYDYMSQTTDVLTWLAFTPPRPEDLDSHHLAKTRVWVLGVSISKVETLCSSTVASQPHSLWESSVLLGWWFLLQLAHYSSCASFGSPLGYDTPLDYLAQNPFSWFKPIGWYVKLAESVSLFILPSVFPTFHSLKWVASRLTKVILKYSQRCCIPPASRYPNVDAPTKVQFRIRVCCERHTSWPSSFMALSCLNHLLSF